MNKVLLVGNLTADPIKKDTANGKAVVNFTIACNEPMRKEATFVPCTAWGQTAEFISSYIKKGETLSIEGSIRKRSYVNKEGKNVSVFEINVERAESVGKRTKTDSNNMVSVNDNFDTNIVRQDFNANVNDKAFGTKKHTANNNMEELDWINENSEDK